MSDDPTYSLVRPCDNCPFRSDIRPYLLPARVREIDRALIRGEFYCHKTTTQSISGEKPRDQKLHCAGALILLEKLGRSSQMMRIAERLGMYDHTKLDMTAPVVDSFDQMIERSK